MAKNVPDAVHEICLSFPESECTPGHGMPDFKVQGKSFATFVVNHHGDGNLALWLRSPPGAQQLYTENEPEFFFVPPYVGPKGWLGVHLDHGLDWNRIAHLVREAYEQVASKTLGRKIGDTIIIEPPTETIDPEDFDALVAPPAQALLAQLRHMCMALPEVHEDRQFGNPCWKAGKKTFCIAFRQRRAKRMSVEIWVGAEQQGMLAFDKRFHVPAFTGHNGWMVLDIEQRFDVQEVQSLIEQSYRHFALKRMLKALDGL